MPYKFNTRDVVQVLPGVERALEQFVNRRGIILYHAEYGDEGPTAEVVLIGARLPDIRRYRTKGQINITVGGTPHKIPIKFLRKTRVDGRVLRGEGTLT